MLHYQPLKETNMTAKKKTTNTLTESVKRKLSLLDPAAERQKVSKSRPS